MADIVDDFLTRLSRHMPELPIEKRLLIEKDIRQQHGGAEPGYIAKGINGYGKETRRLMVCMGLNQQKPMRKIFSELGIGRATGYRILGDK